MPHSVSSYRSDDESGNPPYGLSSHEDLASPALPTFGNRRSRSFRIETDLDENSSLLGHGDTTGRHYRSIPSSVPGTPRPLHRHNSHTQSIRLPRNRSGVLTRNGSFSGRLVNALTASSDARHTRSIGEPASAAGKYNH